MSKKGHINRKKKPDSTKKAKYKKNTQRHFQTHITGCTAFLKDNICIYRIKLTQLLNVSKILFLLSNNLITAKLKA